jgi:hypothetical protein
MLSGMWRVCKRATTSTPLKNITTASIKVHRPSYRKIQGSKPYRAIDQMNWDSNVPIALEVVFDCSDQTLGLFFAFRMLDCGEFARLLFLVHCYTKFGETLSLNNRAIKLSKQRLVTNHWLSVLPWYFEGSAQVPIVSQHANRLQPMRREFGDNGCWGASPAAGE